MEKKLKIGYVVLFLVVLLVFIRIYGSLNNHCSDEWNKTLLKIELRLCFWNAMHVLFFLGICVFLQPKTIVEHLIIFGIGVIWFAMQVIVTKRFGGELFIEDNQKCTDSSYSDILWPKLDDFVYNSLGQVIFVFTTLPFFVENW
jgi:hypothetical protein